MLDLAKAQEWQRCNGCEVMVELTEGCNHIRFVPYLLLLLIQMLTLEKLQMWLRVLLFVRIEVEDLWLHSVD